MMEQMAMVGGRDAAVGKAVDRSGSKRMATLEFVGREKGRERVGFGFKKSVTAMNKRSLKISRGFCWGAKVVVERSKSDYLQAAVLLHPSLVTVDDIKELKVPIAILGAEIDKISPPELLKQFEEGLSSKREINGYVKIFPGVAHGWTVRYKVDDEKAEIKGKLYGSN
ncbi:hypothetical protein TEA_003119 [Camellia sinensis var. sinensis]|uniref:Dienelactone hydrolase domain-containing protein n=1 Tax=Camellia sinensis var. sinensis TaxID=542762 RepID=A0A4S4DJB8_CAMSN|nr:hypothetical protein TEA_003119 [Camellia sinensis var. sinensis]